MTRDDVVEALTAERYGSQWWGARLASHIGTDEGELRVFDDCEESVTRRRRLLAAAVEGWHSSEEAA